MASGTIKAVVGREDIVDNLTTNDGTKVLSAKQGKVLSDQIETLTKLGTVITFSVSADTSGDAYYDFTGASSIAGYDLIGYHAYVGSYRVCVLGVSGTRCYYTVKYPGSSGTTVQIALYPMYKKS